MNQVKMILGFDIGIGVSCGGILCKQDVGASMEAFLFQWDSPRPPDSPDLVVLPVCFVSQQNKDKLKLSTSYLLLLIQELKLCLLFTISWLLAFNYLGWENSLIFCCWQEKAVSYNMTVQRKHKVQYLNVLFDRY